jgi:hypothetical protein
VRGRLRVIREASAIDRSGAQDRRSEKESVMKLALAIALIVLGVIGLAYGGISFTHEKKDVDLGPIQVSHETRNTLPLPPIVGGVCLVAGVAILILSGKRP